MDPNHTMAKSNQNLSKFFSIYTYQLKNALNKVNINKLEKIINLLENKFKSKNKVFICGNGGSAAISKHYICDYLKLLRQNTNFKPKIISLVDNIELITAISNDISYSDIFKYQAESLCEKNDLILIISSSGNSQNVVKLARWAKKEGVKVISFTGFDGGLIKKLSFLNINIDEKNYGRVEDSHHILMHIMMHFLSIKNRNKKITL